jgi:hypothetical protein
MPKPQRSQTALQIRVMALPPGGVLDWRDPSHWSEEARPCRFCGSPTHMRDAKGPADKVCVERDLAEIDRIINVYSGQVQL